MKIHLGIFVAAIMIFAWISTPENVENSWSAFTADLSDSERDEL